MAASEAYVIDAVRTAVGKKGGALAGYHPIDLGVEAYRGIFARNDIDPAAFDDVIVGCVDAIGGQAGNIGRLTWLAAGYDEPQVTTLRERRLRARQRDITPRRRQEARPTAGRTEMDHPPPVRRPAPGRELRQRLAADRIARVAHLRPPAHAAAATS